MRIEHLFSKLESRTSAIFRRISTAVAEGRGHIDILEKDVHLLFKFMYLCLKRSEQSTDEFENPYRENDFVFQQMFQDSKRGGRSGNPTQVWLESLLYLLEASHEHLVADAEKADGTSSAGMYKHFTEYYALQVRQVLFSFMIPRSRPFECLGSLGSCRNPKAAPPSSQTPRQDIEG